MKMISYWQEWEEIYNDNGLVFIIGLYNHKNEDDCGYKELGMYRGNFPQSRDVLSPIVIPPTTRIALLSGLLEQAIKDGNVNRIKSLKDAIDYFK